VREARRLVFASEKCQSSIGMGTYNGNQLVQHGIEWWRADPMNNDGKGRGTSVAQIPTKSEVSVLISGLGTCLSTATQLRRGSSSSFLSFLNSLRLPLLFFLSITPLHFQNGLRCSLHPPLCLPGPRPEASGLCLPRCACFPLPAGNPGLLPEPAW
jgi:hypothetical protein